MSTPVFCSVKETKGSLREELLTRGYIIAFFISHNKYKFRFCFSEEEVEAEHKAARQMHERLGKYGYSKMYFGYVPEVPYLPHTSQRGSTDSAEEFLIIRYQAIDYGHDNRPSPEDWYPDRAGLNEWRASLTNADVTIRYLSQGQYELGFNCDYGLFILAKEHGEWVWPNKAQLNLAYQSIVKANIPEKDVVIHIKPANTHGGGLTKEKAMRKLFPEARIIEEKWDNAYNCALSTTSPVDPDNERRKIARTIREIGEANPPIGGKKDLLPAESFNYPFEEVLSWLRTYVDAGYPVIFKDEAARYIIESMVAYLKRPEDETGIFNFQENKLSDEASVLTRMDRDTFEEVAVTVGCDCVALSSDAYRRGYKDPLYWNATGLYTNRKERLFNSFVDDVRASKEPVLYFVAGSDNKTRKSLVDGRELLATSLTPADILYLAYQHGMNMPEMVVEKALPGQRGLLVRTNITK